MHFSDTRQKFVCINIILGSFMLPTCQHSPVKFVSTMLVIWKIAQLFRWLQHSFYDIGELYFHYIYMPLEWLLEIFCQFVVIRKLSFTVSVQINSYIISAGLYYTTFGYKLFLTKNFLDSYKMTR